MLQANILKKLSIALGLACILGIALLEGFHAKKKLFWVDEYFEIRTVCNYGWGELLKDGGVGSGSRAPLYFFLQKASVNLAKSYDYITIHYRAVSLASAIILLLVGFFFLIEKFKSTNVAIAFITALCAQLVFHSYAAENRPYMFWSMLFTIVNLYAIHLASTDWGKIKTKHWLSFSILCILLSLTATPGMLQAIICIWSIGLIKIITKETVTKKIFQLFLAISLPLSFLCIIAGYYYMHTASSSEVHIAYSPIFDVLIQLERGDISLIAGVLRLLFPKQDLLGSILIILLFIGFAIPYCLYFHRTQLSSRQKTIFSTSLIIYAQIALSIPLAIMVALKHYYFVHRIFIYLIPCNAILVAMGLAYLEEVQLAEKWKRLLPYLKHGATILFITICVKSLHFYYQTIPTKYLWQEPNVLDPNAQCEQWKGKLHIMVDLEQEYAGHGMPTNFIVRLRDELRRCGWEKGEQTSYVVAKSIRKKYDWYKLHEEKPSDHNRYKTLYNCGKKVILDPN